jgi:hypothetical protein
VATRAAGEGRNQHNRREPALSEEGFPIRAGVARDRGQASRSDAGPGSRKKSTRPSSSFPPSASSSLQKASSGPQG